MPLFRMSLFRMPLFKTGVLCLLALPFVSHSLRAQTDDGGVTYESHEEVLQSIVIPNIPNAPFSLTLSTEWVRIMRNGGTYTTVNARPIKRDSAGRTYMERWTLVPKGTHSRSAMTWIQIEDPVAHTYYECNVMHHICDLTEAKPTPRGPNPALLVSGTLPGGRGTHTHEDLGSQSFAGLPVHGYRETTTLNSGTNGNDLPMSTVREFLYSPDLGFNLRSMLDTAQLGRQTFIAQDVTTTEPDPSFFHPPVGYELRDHRQPSRP
jgi:hypothetical protein